MKYKLLVLITSVCCFLNGKAQTDVVFVEYLNHLKNLEFEKALLISQSIQNNYLAETSNQLAELLLKDGQGPPVTKIKKLVNADKFPEIYVVQQIFLGYYDLYYDKLEGKSFLHFFLAYTQAQSLKNIELQKISIRALLNHYHFEFAQNSENYLHYLNELTSLSKSEIDITWYLYYDAIFYSKRISAIDMGLYQSMISCLAEQESKLNQDHPLIAKIYFEQAIGFKSNKCYEAAESSFLRCIDRIDSLTYFNNTRFLCYINLADLYRETRKFDQAFNYMDLANNFRSKSNLLGSNYYFNLYYSDLMRDLEEFELAYNHLYMALRESYYVTRQRNSLQTNRLSVQLQTEQKEIENIRLKQTTSKQLLLLFILGSIVVLTIVAYLFINQKRRLLQSEKKHQASQIDALIKRQEILELDAMIKGEEKERKRLADELHDNLGSVFALISNHFNDLKDKRKKLELYEDDLMDKTSVLIEEAYQTIRSMAHLRNERAFDPEEFYATINRFIEELNNFSDIKFELVLSGQEYFLPKEVCRNLINILRELSTNIIKHSEATESNIYLTVQQDNLSLIVEDNGTGIDKKKLTRTEGMGIDSVKKRALNLNGVCQIDSNPKSGTSVIINIPLK